MTVVAAQPVPVSNSSGNPTSVPAAFMGQIPPAPPSSSSASVSAQHQQQSVHSHAHQQQHQAQAPPLTIHTSHQLQHQQQQQQAGLASAGTIPSGGEGPSQGPGQNGGPAVGMGVHPYYYSYSPSTSTFRPAKRHRPLTEDEAAAITRNFTRGDFYIGSSGVSNDSHLIYIIVFVLIPLSANSPWRLIRGCLCGLLLKVTRYILPSWNQFYSLLSTPSVLDKRLIPLVPPSGTLMPKKKCSCAMS